MSEVRKFFLESLRCHNCDMPQISLISTDILTKREKSAILFRFCFFYYLKGGNLEAALLVSTSNFVDKNAGRNN